MGHPLAKGAAIGLVAALLFGMSTPIAKLLLPGSGPFMMAGLLYLGSGLGLLAVEPLRRGRREAPLNRADAIPLAAVVLAGGVAGPALLMYGLGRLPGSSASLLLNLEAPFTIVLAVVAFRESLERAELVGAGTVVLGAAVLGLQGTLGNVQLLGALAVAAACFAWAVDNNLSQRLALHDPVAIARVKSLVAGAMNVVTTRTCPTRTIAIVTDAISAASRAARSPARARQPAQRRERLVDLLLRGGDAGGEPHRSMRKGPERAVGNGRAVQTGAHRDAEGAVQCCAEIDRLPPVHGDGDDRDLAPRVAGPVHSNARDVPQAGEKPRRERRLVGLDVREPEPLQDAQRGAQPRDPDGVDRPRLERFRQLLRLPLLLGAGARAALS